MCGLVWAVKVCAASKRHSMCIPMWQQKLCTPCKTPEVPQLQVHTGSPRRGEQCIASRQQALREALCPVCCFCFCCCRCLRHCAVPSRVPCAAWPSAQQTPSSRCALSPAAAEATSSSGREQQPSAAVAVSSSGRQAVRHESSSSMADAAPAPVHMLQQSAAQQQASVLSNGTAGVWASQLVCLPKSSRRQEQQHAGSL